jgi:hypothetical protein
MDGLVHKTYGIVALSSDYGIVNGPLGLVAVHQKGQM